MSLQRQFFSQLGVLGESADRVRGQVGLYLGKDASGVLMSAGLPLAGNNWIGLLTCFPVHA